MPAPSPAALLEVHDLPKLQAEATRTGGRLILYKTVFSFVLASSTSPRVLCVHPGEGRRFMGALASFPTVLLGWWSPQGFAWTIIALIWNFRGGVDVTEALLPGAKASDGVDWVERYNRFDTRARRLGFTIAATPFVVLFVYVLFTRK